MSPVFNGAAAAAAALLAFAAIAACSAKSEVAGLAGAPSCAAEPCAAPASDGGGAASSASDATAANTANGQGELDAFTTNACPGVDPTRAPSATSTTGRFVVAGAAQRSVASVDAVHWTIDVTPPVPADAKAAAPAIQSMTFGNGMFVAGAGAEVLSSPDGTTWTPRTLPSTPYPNVEAVGFGNGKFIATSTHWHGDARFYHSTDGITWSEPFVVPEPCCRRIRAIAYGGGKFVAVGQGRRTIVSDDGIAWRDDKQGIDGDFPVYTALAYGNATWVAVGTGGIIVTSPDGVSWTTAVQPHVVGEFHGVAFDGTKFVTCARVACYSSTDGQTWMAAGAFSDPRPTEAILFADGIFVGLDVPSRVLTSKDGLAWTPTFCGAPPRLAAIAYRPN